MTKFTGNLTLIGAALATLVAGCAEEVPVRTVTEFMEDQIGLEATLARCNTDRRGTRNDPECRNAREANKRMASEREAELQRRFDEESQRKRDAIRARNEATEAARRRAEEAAREREEFLYEQQFNGDASSVAPNADTNGAAQSSTGPSDGAAESPVPGVDEAAEDSPDDTAAPADEETTDLDAVRRELERRNQDSNQRSNDPVG
ncbi:MAG: EexN family lipoprotein [Pseudomonadota bacterium]